MALNDLKLEFEDEEEFKKKKNDAVHVDVDLVFQSQEAVSSEPRVPKAPHSGEVPNNVRPLPSKAPAQNTASRPLPGPPALKASASSPPGHKETSKNQEELLEQMKKMEFEAEVKVRVADFKAEILGELIGDVKLLEYQIGQMLARINAKHPDLKQEALMIKKLLADFAAKKRK